LNLWQAVFLFFAGLTGGALNSVAGGGSFVAFPALLFVGVPPIPANATNTIALWTAAAASGGAYRSRLNSARRVLIALLTASLLGGICGAVLLLKTPAHTFLQVLPWLTLSATLLFIFARRIANVSSSGAGHEVTGPRLAVITFAQFAVGVYGGYFGGGMGIVMLAMLAALGMTDIHSMNALKSVMGWVINGVAVVTFIAAHAIYWREGAVMILGGLVGGYFGAHYAIKLSQAAVRWFVILTGTAMTIYFFVEAYG
jgi:uncharacterized protein